MLKNELNFHEKVAASRECCSLQSEFPAEVINKMPQGNWAIDEANINSSVENLKNSLFAAFFALYTY